LEGSQLQIEFSYECKILIKAEMGILTIKYDNCKGDIVEWNYLRSNRRLIQLLSLLHYT